MFAGVFKIGTKVTFLNAKLKLEVFVKKVLFVAVILFFLIVILNCYSKPIVRVTQKWLYYHPSKEIRVIIYGVDEDGKKQTIHKSLSPKKFYPNGYFYEYGMFNLYEWYGSQLIYENNGRYYVVGFTVSEILSYDDHIEVHLSPCFMFDWGLNIKTQKVYLNIDYDRCPEISKEQVKPFLLKKVKEKFLYDKINRNGNKYKNRAIDEINKEEYMNMNENNY